MLSEFDDLKVKSQVAATVRLREVKFQAIAKNARVQCGGPTFSSVKLRRSAGILLLGLPLKLYFLDASRHLEQPSLPSACIGCVPLTFNCLNGRKRFSN